MEEVKKYVLEASDKRDLPIVIHGKKVFETTIKPKTPNDKFNKLTVLVTEDNEYVVGILHPVDFDSRNTTYYDRVFSVYYVPLRGGGAKAACNVFMDFLRSVFAELDFGEWLYVRDKIFEVLGIQDACSLYPKDFHDQMLTN